MRYVVLAGTVGLFLLSSGSGPLGAEPQTAPGSAPKPASMAAGKAADPEIAAHRALLDRYCVGCHNQRAKIAGLMFDKLDLAHVPADAEIWEKAARKLRGGMMPPPGAKQPDRAAVDSLVSWLETKLDQASASNLNPGRVALHRMNRGEYANAIEDLLGVRVDASALLPTDDVSDGFDNIAAVLKVSPSFMDQYVSAAQLVSTQAVGTPVSTQPSKVTLRGGVNGDAHGVGGAPLGLRPTLMQNHLFPADGEYEFRFATAAGRGAAPGIPATGGAGPEAAVITLDGVKVPATGRVAVKAGMHKIAVSVPEHSLIESDQPLESFTPGNPGIVYGGGPGRSAPAGVEINGPFSPGANHADTLSRQRIFVCHPATPDEEESCAKAIFSNLARKAFRRPVTDQDLAAPMKFYGEGKAAGGFEGGIQGGLMAILASPKFLYRAERDPAKAAPGSNHRISDLELASRLSYFLWSSAPDDELLNLAEQGKLSDPAMLERQVRRMLAQPRSDALVTNFEFEWLKVRDLDRVDPDAVLFPAFDPSLRAAFRKEMELFLRSIINDDRSVVDMLNANYTYANERLAMHYGIPNVRGDQFRRVTLPDSRRWGLLGKGAILMVTSYPNRTAPVLRGAWILENIAGTPPAAPPPNVEGFKENKEGEKALTVREIMEKHRANPSCNACHGVMDPLGFALENFDAIGAWRTKDKWADTVIDSSGRLVDGTPVSGPDDLRKAMMRHPEQFVRTMTEKMMTYALGRRAEYYDMPAVRKIVRGAAQQNYRFSAIVLGIVKSAPFQMRKAPDAQLAQNRP